MVSIPQWKTSILDIQICCGANGYYKEMKIHETLTEKYAT